MMVLQTSSAAGKTERLEARIPADLKSVFVRAAGLRGQTLTDFVVTSATEAAQRTIREREILQLSARDQIAFARDLLRAPKPNARLKAAERRYRRLVKA